MSQAKVFVFAPVADDGKAHQTLQGNGCELILGKAHAEAREIQRRAYSDNERLTHVSRRVRAQLVEALSAFDDPKPEDAAQEVEPEATQESDSGEERSWYGVPDADAA